jgi:leader peptidase (prepilin peptidase)/N-methyltransferase
VDSTAALGALAGAAICGNAGLFLGRLTVTVPDAEVHAWWRGAPASRRARLATGYIALGLGALAGAAAGWSALLPALLALAILGAPLIAIDLEHHRLPNRLIRPLALAAALLLTVAAAATGDWHRVLRSLEGAAAVFAVLYVLAWISPASFGLGDVRLGGILGAYLGWFGWPYVYYGIFAGFLIGALVGVAVLASRRGTMKTAIPFGPMLIVGALVVMAFQLVPALS